MALAGAAGCVWVRERPPQPLVAAPEKIHDATDDRPGGSIDLDDDDDDAQAAAKAAAPQINVTGPSIVVTDVVGTNMATAGAMLAPAMAALERCHAPTGLMLRLRLTASRDRKTVQIERASSVSGQTGACVVNALRSMELDDVLQHSASPSEQGPQVDALLIFTW